uniref:Endonuclease/exonuclease/phosphatase domain-containing protein n=1 Tax=Kalanchoe fedtschenkoi TaxID=63787 RepID=A0A7N0VH81_KALFE
MLLNCQFLSHRKKCNTSIYRLAYGRKCKLGPCPLLRQMCNDETRRLLVGNIHVVFRPSRGDVKLGQVRFLSSKAHSLSEKWGNVPVVLAGDFNCTPNSPIYKFLSTSKLNVMLHDRRELSGQKNCHPDQVFGIQRPFKNPYSLIDSFFKHSWTNTELKNATGDAEMEVAVHPLKLRSTYTMLKGSDSTRDSSCEPLATSYHSKFIGTVDYLWFTDGVVPTKVLDTVPIGALRKIGGLPSKAPYTSLVTDPLPAFKKICHITRFKKICLLFYSIIIFSMVAGSGYDHLTLVAEFAFT